MLTEPKKLTGGSIARSGVLADVGWLASARSAASRDACLLAAVRRTKLWCNPSP